MLRCLVRSSVWSGLVCAVLASAVAGCGWRSGLDDFSDASTMRVDGGGGGFDGSRPDGGFVGCTRAADCTDGVFCNGEEQCLGGRCSPGRAVGCDDGVDCTRDTCSEAMRSCSNVPDSMLCPPGELCELMTGCSRRPCMTSAECDDGVFCNGMEMCSRGGICVGGVGVRCEDGDPCSDEFCDEGVRSCVSRLTDRDSDGSPLCDGDCNDADPRIFPGAREICRDGLDNDCNGPADCMDVACFGTPGCGMMCTVPDRDSDGFDAIPCGGDDCDDANPLVNPFAFEACSNGIDDNCDALTDCADMACAGVPPCVMCVPRSMFEVGCNDGIDDDCDGRFDCADPDCGMSPLCMVPCGGIDLGSRVGLSVASGSTSGAPNTQGGTCGGSMAPEIVYRWTAPSSGPFVFDTVGSGYDTMLYLRDGSCMGAELACNDDIPGSVQSQVTVRLSVGQVVFIFMDGFGASSGRYVLNIRSMLGSEIGFCFDRIDNDGDGRTDCADPDCIGEPGCCMGIAEICNNGADDDCDRLVDCVDPSCTTSPFCVPPPPDAGIPPRRDAGTRDAGAGCTAGEYGVAACTNGRDEDCDGRGDCLDPDCSPFGPMGECCNGVDDNMDGIADEFTCRCFSSAECASVGDLDQVCWTSSFAVCAPRCNFYGGDLYCRTFFMGMPICNAMTGECIP